MNPNRNHYQILGIDPKASEDEIRKAYKKLARTYHPDLNPKRPRSAHDRFRRLQEAYDVLSDPISRQQYDQSLGIGPTNAQTNEAGHTEIKSGSWTVDIDQEETRERWLDQFNWRFISGLLLSILSASWLVYLVNLEQSRVTRWWFAAGRRRFWSSAEIALILFWVGIGLILFDTFSSKPQQKKLEAEEESLREAILAMLPDANESQRGLNDYINQKFGKPGILSLELSELERVKEYLQGRIKHQRPPSSQTYTPYPSAPGEFVRPEYKDYETVYFQGEKEKTGWLGSISWRHKLAIVVWAVCLLGAFLPGTIWVGFLRTSSRLAPSFGVRLLWPTIALIMIWIGKRMSDDDGFETSIGTLGNETIGYVLEVLAWLSFAYVMWGTLTGFVGYLSF